MTTENRALVNSIAGGAVSFALLDLLHAKGIITLDEARSVLQNAIKQISAAGNDGFEASRIIADLLSGRFSARS